MKNIKPAATMILLLMATTVGAQTRVVTLDSLLNTAYRHNKGLQSVTQQKAYYQLQRKTSSAIPKTDVSLTYGQYNSFYKRDNNITISQTIPFPSVFSARASLADAQVKGATFQLAVTKNELTLKIRQVYYQLQYWNDYQKLLLVQDTIFRKMLRATELRYKAGESALLEKTTAETRLSGLQHKLVQVEAETRALYLQLHGLLNVSDVFTVETDHGDLPVFAVDSTTLAANPQLMLTKQQVEIASREKSIVAKTALPELKIGYFNQSLFGVPLNDAQTQFAGASNRFQGFQLGLIFPLWFSPDVNRAKVAQKQVEINQLNYEAGLIELKSNYNSTLQQFSIALSNLNYYRSTALPNAQFIQKQSQLAYDKGEIGYTEHVLNIQQVMAIQEAYLEALSNYNQTGIYLEYLTAR